MTLLQSFGVSVDQFTWQSFADRKFLWLIHPVQNVAELMGNATGNAVGLLHGTVAIFSFLVG